MGNKVMILEAAAGYVKWRVHEKSGTASPEAKKV